MAVLLPADDLDRHGDIEMSQARIRDFFPRASVHGTHDISPEGSPRSEDAPVEQRDKQEPPASRQGPLREAGVSDLHGACGEQRLGNAQFFADFMSQQKQLFATLADTLGKSLGKRGLEVDPDSPVKCKVRIVESESSEEESQPGDDLESALNNFCQDSDDEKMYEVPGEEDFYDELRKFFTRDEKLAAPVSQESADLVAKALNCLCRRSRKKTSWKGLYVQAIVSV